jgi:hypothetical protein
LLLGSHQETRYYWWNSKIKDFIDIDINSQPNLDVAIKKYGMGRQVLFLGMVTTLFDIWIFLPSPILQSSTSFNRLTPFKMLLDWWCLATQLGTSRRKYDEHNGKFPSVRNQGLIEPVGERNHF